MEQVVTTFEAQDEYSPTSEYSEVGEVGVDGAGDDGVSLRAASFLSLRCALTP
jgi:hypothetical protein